MATAGVPEENSTIERPKNGRIERKDYWKKVVSHYEKRNASLERKQAALVERVRFMECVLPSLLMGAVAGAKLVPEVSKNKVSTCSRMNSEQSCASSSPSCASHEKRSMRFAQAKECSIKIDHCHGHQMQNHDKP